MIFASKKNVRHVYSIQSMLYVELRELVCLMHRYVNGNAYTKQKNPMTKQSSRVITKPSGLVRRLSVRCRLLVIARCDCTPRILIEYIKRVGWSSVDCEL